MRYRRMDMLAAWCVVLVMLFGGGRVAAQTPALSENKPVMYTYVSEWSVPRAMWEEFLKNETLEAEMYKKAVTDGTLTSFGSYTVLNHSEEGATHGTWFSSGSMASILKFLEELQSAPGTSAAPLLVAKHWDHIFQSRNYNAQSGAFTNGYLRVGTWHPRAGSKDADGKVVKSTIVALCEKLMADGALHAYQIDEEAVHTSDPGTLFFGLVMNGGEGLDKFNAALEEAQKSNSVAWAGFGAAIETVGHRDMLARVTAMSHK